MPTIVSTVYTDCTQQLTGSAVRFIKNVTDTNGTGVLIWDVNNGVLPDYPALYLDVFANGVRKEFGTEYTIARNTAPGQSTINITVPIAGVYYNIIMYG